MSRAVCEILAQNVEILRKSSWGRREERPPLATYWQTSGGGNRQTNY